MGENVSSFILKIKCRFNNYDIIMSYSSYKK